MLASSESLIILSISARVDAFSSRNSLVAFSLIAVYVLVITAISRLLVWWQHRQALVRFQVGLGFRVLVIPGLVASLLP